MKKMKNYILSLSVVLLIIGCTPKKKADEKNNTANTEIRTDEDSENESEDITDQYESEDVTDENESEDVTDENEDDSESENEVIKTSVIYVGFKDYKFNFIYFNEDEKDYLIFDTISKEILSEFDLKSDKFKGQKFKVNYKIETSGDDEVFILGGLEKI